MQTLNGGAINVTGTGGTTTATSGVSVTGIQLGRGNSTNNPPIDRGTVTTDSGAIILAGTGGTTTNFAAGPTNQTSGAGVRLLNGSAVTATGAGSVSITGTGGFGNTAARYASIFMSSDQGAPAQPNNTIGSATATAVLLRSIAGTGIILNDTDVRASSTIGAVTLNASSGGAVSQNAGSSITSAGLRLLNSAPGTFALNAANYSVGTLVGA